MQEIIANYSTKTKFKIPRGMPYYCLYGEASPQRATLFSLQVYAKGKHFTSYSM